MHFFFYDTTKIALLLTGVIFVVTVLRSFMSIERTRALLGGKREGVGNVFAAGLGVVTPFCSCSAVPAFIGFVAAGVPLGVTLSFLIASPLVNEVAIVLLFGLFGWKVTALYIVGGMVIAIIAGAVLGRLRLERWVEPFVFETRLRGKVIDPSAGLSWDDRLLMAREEVVSILRKIWPYLLVGIGLGAAIHGWLPADWFAAHATGWWGVPLAVVIGVPLYSNAAGVLPLVEALHDKGLPMGTVLAFMMSVVASVDTGDDPAATCAQAQAHRHVLRCRRDVDLVHRLPVQPRHLKGKPWTSRSSAPAAPSVRPGASRPRSCLINSGSRPTSRR